MPSRRLFDIVVTMRKPVPGVSRLALARFSGRARRLLRMRGEVQVLVTGNREMQDLNRRFRGKDKPTDVLSFPAAHMGKKNTEMRASRPRNSRRGAGGTRHAGDIAISAEIATENARGYGHAPAQELKILILHGLLHLAGYDHERDNGRMGRVESRLRRELRLPDSLIARSVPRRQP